MERGGRRSTGLAALCRGGRGGGGGGAGAEAGVAILGGSPRRRAAMKGMRGCSGGGGSSSEASCSPPPSSGVCVCVGGWAVRRKYNIYKTPTYRSKILHNYYTYITSIT